MKKPFSNLTYSLTQAIEDAEKQKKEEASLKTVSSMTQTTSITQNKGLPIPDFIDIKEIRQRLNISQAEFSERFGINLNTLRNWEQGRRLPDEATRAYLYAISRNAALVEEALRS